MQGDNECNEILFVMVKLLKFMNKLTYGYDQFLKIFRLIFLWHKIQKSSIFLHYLMFS